MRLIALTVLAASALLTSCAPQTESDRTAIEAGGTVPWNRPEKWEGPGVLGSQMQAAQGGY